MKRLIIFLIRHHLGLKKGQEFRFVNQKSPTDTYYFDKDCLMKVVRGKRCIVRVPSNVSLNWLLNDECDFDVVDD